MIGQKNPGGEQESLPRAHSVQRPRQDGEVLFVEVVVPREQFHGQKKEPVGEQKTPQPRRGVRPKFLGRSESILLIP